MWVYRASTYIRCLMGSYYPPGEEELTRQFLEKLCASHRIRSYMTTHAYEARIGADWLWLIFTNSGITPFLVQAKKLKPGQQQIGNAEVRHARRSGPLQIDLLTEVSHATGIPALYALYSDSIAHVPCGSKQPNTGEGVFFDVADNIHDRFLGTGQRGLKHMPISCMFSCLSRKCHYFPDQKVCKSCLKCKHGKRTRYPECRDPKNACLTPFDQFFQRTFGLKVSPIPIDRNTLPLLYCHSVLTDHPEYIPSMLSKQTAEAMAFCSRVIITDYMNRHDHAYARSIMGPDFVVDDSGICELEDILEALHAAKQKYTVFRKLGLFGSYARGEATCKSDIDIAIVYNEAAFRSEEAFLQVTAFVTEMLERFHKNIDFVDYLASYRNPNCKDFIISSNSTMIWISI